MFMMRQQVQFLKEFVSAPSTVGAVVPSSAALARALCEPYAQADRPAAVLEVGAGTGAVTRYLGSILRGEDRLDICEIKPHFADHLERNVLSHTNFAGAVAVGRVRLMRGPVQQLLGKRRYDFIISSLPLTAFNLADIREILAGLQASLKPGGVFSYFEYIGLRKLSRNLLLGKKRLQAQQVSRFLNDNIRSHQFYRRTVLLNFPPAYARHWRFDDAA